MSHYAENLRRLMARQGLTVQGVVERSGLDTRTVKGILSGANARPQARTLYQLATGLDAPADELFQNPSVLAHRSFDRTTNPVVGELVAAHPELFDGWTRDDFDELYSHFGMGGGLTPEGAFAIVEHQNHKRIVHGKVALVLESSQAEVLSGIVDLLYEKVMISEDASADSMPV